LRHALIICALVEKGADGVADSVHGAERARVGTMGSCRHASIAVAVEVVAQKVRVHSGGNSKKGGNDEFEHVSKCFNRLLKVKISGK
jgi:hypothetical protein